MAEKALMLNLGCGVSYRPGRVNIDGSQMAVSDIIADAANLPYEDNSVGSIEAYQLIEHFDLVHCKFVLCEWYRILKVNGTLTIETPDFKQAAKKFLSGPYKNKVSTLNWVFGIDSPGLLHKVGFDFSMIEGLLHEIGFVDVSRTPARTHTYEPGMRITCSKPEGKANDQLLSRFMRRVKSKFKSDDSFVLIPLDDCLNRVREACSNPRGPSVPSIVEIVSMCAVCHPIVALCFVDELEASGRIEIQQSDRLRDVLKMLVEMSLHERLLTLWMNSKKGLDFEEDFDGFVERIRNDLAGILMDPASAKAKLEYLIGLQPTPIGVFNRRLVQWEAERSSSDGLKAFCEGRIKSAIASFERSLRMNPASIAAQWNLARLGIMNNSGESIVRYHYQSARALARNRGLRERISNEMSQICDAKVRADACTPVTEDDLL